LLICHNSGQTTVISTAEANRLLEQYIGYSVFKTSQIIHRSI
jgi:hypothetical protein